ncbi:MAG: Phosphate transporter substrate-binding protein PhoT family [Verrucomicrobia bacterium]|nr:Phosphate transporter substrate-binding protein PhoT family [Verrucomicrobiota bacterium]
MNIPHSPSARRLVVAAALSLGLLQPDFALKNAAVEHHLQADPSLPTWTPGKVDSIPEEELNLVGADIMDEITLGWIKLYRPAYPRLSVTMEARSSGSGVPALTAGNAHMAPVGREALPKEYDAFVKKFGYEPFRIKVATGSLGSLGKTATSIFLVAKSNPIEGLTFSQIDAIYSSTRKRGHAEIKTWGELGLTGEWANRPIHTYGLKPPNGIEQFVKWIVLEDGEWKPGIQAVKGQGFTHAFTVASNDMHTQLGGLSYALLANVTPDVRVVPLAEKDGDPFIMPTIDTVYHHTYPLSRYVYIYVNRPPGKPLEPKIKEFLKLVLSQQGQHVVAEEGVFMPLLPEVVQEELAKLE